MTDETKQANNDLKTDPTFGDRLKSAREELRLEVQDVASQLRLRKNIIEMLENDMYSDDVPLTFLRGYIRSYGKFLDLPEKDITAALEPLQPKPAKTLFADQANPAEANYGKIRSDKDSTVSKYFKKYAMTIVTLGVIATLLSMMVTWWHSHKNQLVVVTPPVVSLNDAIAAADIDETNGITAQSEPILPTLAEDQANINITPAPVHHQAPVVAKPQENNAAPIIEKKTLAERTHKKVIDVYNY